jgi:hypothetical protein
MAVPARTPRAENTIPSQGVAQLLSVIILVLAAVASTGGLFIPGLYRFAAWLVPATRGQDLVTLVVALPALGVALIATRRGSARGALAWIGLLGYICYTYIGAAFAYDFGPFFLIYVALFSLSVFALVAAVSGIDSRAIQQRFDAATPRRAVAAFLTLMAFLLTALWLGRIIPNLTANPVPETIEPFKYVFSLDLGLIVPLMLLGAVWLWRRNPWGPVLAGSMLIKAATMGLALLCMNLFNWRAGQPTDPSELLATYTVIAGGGLGMASWFLRHCREV